MLKRLFVSLLLVAVGVTASAYDFMEGGLCYSVNDDGNTVTLERECIPSGDLKNYGNLPANVAIPASVTHDGATYTVTAIGFEAFAYCENVKQVTIPETVTSIANQAFYEAGLTSVTIPNTVTSIGGNLFFACRDLKSAKLPDSITELSGTFSYCSSLESYVIPETVKIISGAFEGCSALTTITIPEGVELCSGTYGAFNGCTALQTVYWNAKKCTSGNNDSPKAMFSNSLTSIVFGDEVEIIPAGICKGQTYLTSVVLPEKVTAIGAEAFFGCKNIGSITFGNSITTIGSDAFANTAWFNNQPNGLVCVGNVAYKYKGAMPSSGEITINEGCTSIADYCFLNSDKLKKVNMPQTLTKIGEGAFSRCKNLTSAVIPENVVSIGENAFNQCRLGNLIIPDNVVSIGRNAFNQAGLQSVHIGKSLECIGDEYFPSDASVFGENGGLEMITVDAANSTYDSRGGCNALIETASNTLVTGCKNTVIPNTVTAIGRSAFYRCSGLTEIEIPSSVSEIGNGAFRWTGLINVVIPEGVTVIPDYLFENCYRMESATLPLRVREVGEGVFSNCLSLKEVTLPEGCKELKWDLFKECTAITTLKCYAVNPPSQVTQYVLGAINPSVCTLHVPIETLDSYTNTYPWSKFVNVVDDLVRVGDINEDGNINVSDVNLVVSQVLQDGEGENFDLNKDGAVNVSDINLLVSKVLVQQ